MHFLISVYCYSYNLYIFLNFSHFNNDTSGVFSTAEIKSIHCYRQKCLLIFLANNEPFEQYFMDVLWLYACNVCSTVV